MVSTREGGGGRGNQMHAAYWGLKRLNLSVCMGSIYTSDHASQFNQHTSARINSMYS